MKFAAIALGIALMMTAGVPASSEGAARQAGQQSLDAAFVHYDAIRAQLAADEVTDIRRHAEALAVHAEHIGGAPAAKALEGLREARDLKAARAHFAALSTAAVPAFHAAKLKDVHVFTCGMVTQSWAQRGSDVKNPYMGKAMLSCGVPAKSAK